VTIVQPSCFAAAATIASMVVFRFARSIFARARVRSASAIGPYSFSKLAIASASRA
jgi:hypothetical protein